MRKQRKQIGGWCREHNRSRPCTKCVDPLGRDYTISDPEDVSRFEAELEKTEAMTDKPKESAELIARQFAVKAIHEDKLNVKNPSILAKLLNEWGKKCWIEGTHAAHRAFKQ